MDPPYHRKMIPRLRDNWEPLCWSSIFCRSQIPVKKRRYIEKLKNNYKYRMKSRWVIHLFAPSYLFLQVLCCTHLGCAVSLCPPHHPLWSRWWPSGLMSAVLLCSDGGWSLLTEWVVWGRSCPEDAEPGWPRGWVTGLLHSAQPGSAQMVGTLALLHNIISLSEKTRVNTMMCIVTSLSLKAVMLKYAEAKKTDAIVVLWMYLNSWVVCNSAVPMYDIKSQEITIVH